MRIQVKNAGQNTDRVALQGDLDFHSSPDLRQEFAKLADRKVLRILADLKKVNYIDSSGLAAFVELFQRMKSYGGTLVLFDLSQAVRSVFEIAKLDSVFRLARSEEEALAIIS